MQGIADQIAAKMALAACGKDMEDFATLMSWNLTLWEEIDQQMFPRQVLRKSIIDILALGTMF